jgi:hypothetical protein
MLYLTLRLEIMPRNHSTPRGNYWFTRPRKFRAATVIRRAGKFQASATALADIVCLEFAA